MATINNIGNIDVNSLIDTESFFNNTFRPPITVSQNIDDAIIGYFQQIADSREAARNMAAAVILTSVSQGIDPMETLREFAKLDRGQLNQYAAMFLNMNRIGTSYLGITNQPQAGKYIKRLIKP